MSNAGKYNVLEVFKYGVKGFPLFRRGEWYLPDNLARNCPGFNRVLFYIFKIIANPIN